MFDCLSTIDGELENTQIIAKIFSYLNAEELRKVRLLNFSFNTIVTTHPTLFWAKNELRVRIRSRGNENHLQKEWTQLRLHTLVTDYGCPNFHFLKTDILALGAVQFFQSSVRYQIKYLKLTKCTCTWPILAHILACIGRTLEHLEIRDFSRFENALSSEWSHPESRPTPHISCFPCLVTLILSNELSSTSATKMNKASLTGIPIGFLNTVLQGTCKLEKICVELNPKTCHFISKLLCSIDPVRLLHMKALEIGCTNGMDFGAKQYELLKPLGSIYMPNLRKFKINFDNIVIVESERLVDTMSNSVATFIEGSSDTLQSIELVNCPINNNVFRAGIKSFQNLCYVNTRGSFINRLDDYADPIYEHSVKNARSRNSKTSNSDANNNDIRTRSGRLRRFDHRTRLEVYKIMCAVFAVTTLIHVGMTYAFSVSYTGEKLEVFIHAAISLWLTKGYEISEMWASFYE